MRWSKVVRAHGADGQDDRSDLSSTNPNLQMTQKSGAQMDSGYINYNNQSSLKNGSSMPVIVNSENFDDDPESSVSHTDQRELLPHDSMLPNDSMVRRSTHLTAG
jgi:hypothetical protein